MNREAVLHRNTEEFIYPTARDRLVFRIRTAKKEIQKCKVIYWNREDGVKKTQCMECYARDGVFDYFRCQVIFSKIARYQKYYFTLEDIHGATWYFSAYGVDDKPPEDGFFEYLYANGNDVVTTPAWAEGIIYYQIFPERFFNGDRGNDPVDAEAWGNPPTRENYMGGDLRGIMKKLPYLKELGVECLYLTPIFEGDFNHKYATTDYYRIDPAFGTNEEFRELVEQCHRQDIRIILDGVFNHTGIHFPYFQDVLQNQEQSPYQDWFLIEKFPVTVSAEAYECVGAYPYMPKLNTANPEVRSYIIGVMEHWLKEYRIDGWRLDVADEVDDSVWEAARLVLKKDYPECILLGETWGYGGRMLRGNQLDSVMNYLFRDAVRDYFGKNAISTEAFDNRINSIIALYREETCQLLYNLLDSHDTERFLRFCGENKKRLKLAAAFQMLFVGSPAIYYGDEAGMTGENDPDCRRCMIWDERADRELWQWYRKLISLRRTYSCIRRGGCRTILADNEKAVFGFVRYEKDKEDPQRIYALFNNSPVSQRVFCPVAEDTVYIDLLSENGEAYPTERLTEKVSGQNKEAYGTAALVEIQPYAVKVIKKKGGYPYEEK